jgi:hypothetical protein
MKKHSLYLLVGYPLALILGFVGAPKQKFLTYVIAWAIFTAVYAVIALIVNGIYEGSKPKP